MDARHAKSAARAGYLHQYQERLSRADASDHVRALLTTAAQLNDSNATATRNAATRHGAPFVCCRNVSEINGVNPPTIAETWYATDRPV